MEIIGDAGEEDRPVPGGRTSAESPPASGTRAATAPLPGPGHGSDGIGYASVSRTGASTGPVPVIDLGEQPHDADGASAPAPPTPDGGTPAAPDHVVPRPVAVPDSPLARLMWVLGAAESLALSGVAIVVAACVATWPMLFMFLGQEIGPDLTNFMLALGLCGLIGGGLGIAAILRLRPETHPLVRGCAGCAVVIGLLLVVIAAIGTIQASGEHTVPEPTF